MSFDKSKRAGAKPGKKKGPKSTKADGTPKKRWSAAERAAKGHGPRTRGGRRFGDERTDAGFAGEKARERRDDRFSRDDRPRRDDRFSRDDRPRQDRFSRDDRFGRDDRPRREDRFGRDDRPRREDRFSRDDRPRRDDRFGRNDRFGDRDQDQRRSGGRDRFGERSFADRPSRPSRDQRWGGDVRAREDRTGRVNTHDREDSRPWNRDDRRGRGRDERGQRTSEDRRPSWGRDHEQIANEAQADVMEWQQVEVGEVDTSGVDHTGGFSSLGLPDEIVALLAERGITEPFPIQVATIPDALSGRDVLGRARTGSGKTLAFGLPLITRLANDPDTPQHKSGRAPRAMVLVPTRELALQVADVLSPLAASLGMKLVLIAGGMSYVPQLKAFEKGVDIVVATPGRLIDLLEQGAADLSQVQVAVLDEADHMADLGFMPAVSTLLDAIPADGQRLLFSATLDGAVNRLVKTYLHDPLTHEVDSDKGSVATMSHHMFLVKPHDKVAVTARIASREGRTVIFARTQLGADRVAGQLREAGVMAGALHGGLTQGARARILTAFKEGSLPVLVATDVAARGIHVDEVSLVLQLDPPMNAKDYTHRSGRTARAGEDGTVVSLVLPHQRRQTLRMIGSTGVKIDPIDIHPDDKALDDLTGAGRPEGEPIGEDEFKKLVAPRQAARRPRPERKGGWDKAGWDKGNRGGRGSWKGNRGRGRSDRGGDRQRLAEPGGWNRDR